MKDDYTTNSYYLAYAFLFKRLGEYTFWTWEWGVLAVLSAFVGGVVHPAVVVCRWCRSALGFVVYTAVFPTGSQGRGRSCRHSRFQPRTGRSVSFQHLLQNNWKTEVGTFGGVYMMLLKSHTRPPATRSTRYVCDWYVRKYSHQIHHTPVKSMCAPKTLIV